MDKPKAQRRQRAVLSCNDCRRRKLRCDRKLPCDRCIKGGIAEECAYETENQTPLSESLHERPSKRRRESISQSAAPRTEEAPRSYYDVPKLFNPSEFASSDTTAQDQVKHLERQVALLEQQLLVQKSVSLEALRFAGKTTETTSSTTSPRGFLKGRHYGSFYFGPSSPTSIMAYFPGLRAFMKNVYHNSTAQRLAQDMIAVGKATSTNRSSYQIVTISSLRDLLPDRSTTDRLIQKYLSTFETTYRIVHIPTFREAHEQYWDIDKPDGAEMDAVVLSILACTICISTNESPQYSHNGSTLHAQAVLWIKACEAWLRRQSSKHRTLASLQVRCLRLLALSATSHKVKDYYHEVQAHMAIMISCGMHRDPAHFGDRCSTFEGEMRRRLWATSVEIELQASIDKGNGIFDGKSSFRNMLAGTPSMVSRLESDCATPGNFNDAQLSPSQEELPPSEPVEEFTDTSFLFVSTRSLDLRSSLCALTNSLQSRLSFQDTLSHANAIQEYIHNIPNWIDPRSLQARTLLDLQLRQLLVILYAANIADVGATLNTERRYSSIALLEAATAILTLHTALMASSNLALCCTRSDYYRAALLVCHVAYYTHKVNDIMVAQVAMATLDSCAQQALRLQEEKVMLAGRGGQQHWILSAAVGLASLQFEPSRSDAVKLQAIDRVSRLLYKMLSRQDTSGEPPASEVLLQDAPPRIAKQIYRHPGHSAEAISTDSFADVGLRLDAFDFGETSEWMLDDFWFLNEPFGSEGQTNHLI